MKSIPWFGGLLALLGVLGLAIPVFTTSQTKDVVNLGALKTQNTQQSTHHDSRGYERGCLYWVSLLSARPL